MITLRVTTPVTWPAKWVSSLFYPRKPYGTLHICLDPKDLYKAIIWEHYKTPTLNEISHHLSSALTFCKLDAKDSFWSVHLDKKSSYLSTFNTHKGRYLLLHMSFTLQMTQDVFQRCTDQVTDHLPGIIATHDDICVFGQTPVEHDRHLIQMMQTTSKNGNVFNSSRFGIRQPEISFYGAVFISQHMKPDPAEVQVHVFPPLINKTSVLFRTLHLLLALHPRPGWQDDVSAWATLPVGLEPFDW